MKRLKKIPMNVFTFLVFAAVMAIFFRAINIVTSNDGNAGPIATATAQEDKKPEAAANEEPPPLTADEIKKSVAATAEEVDGVGSIKPPAAPAAANAAPVDPLAGGERVFSNSEIEVLQSLSKRRDDLDKREQDLAAREALLKAAEQEVDSKVAELNKLRGEIEALLGKQEKMEGDRITSLVKIYENMKPKEAATIFNTLDMKVLLPVVSAMNERRLSPILAAMETEKARIVTTELAQQRKLPGKEAPKPQTQPQPQAPAPAAPAAEPTP